MATLTKFEEIEIWQLARKLNIDSYPLLQRLITERNFELYKQLEKSLGSIMDNVAEGFERGGTKEFIQFLSVSKASGAEVRSQLYRALDRGLISREEFSKLYADCAIIGEKIGKFINYLRNSGMKGEKYFSSGSKK